MQALNWRGIVFHFVDLRKMCDLEVLCFSKYVNTGCFSSLVR